MGTLDVAVVLHDSESRRLGLESKNGAATFSMMPAHAEFEESVSQWKPFILRRHDSGVGMRKENCLDGKQLTLI
jgi:hypothetical protein